jgi:hypothetical protein
VIEAFKVARTHYEKLGMPERIELDLHDGGHEPMVERGVRFLPQWLINVR